MSDSYSDEYFMELALNQAKLAEEIGEVPVGCVIVKGFNSDKSSEVIATGHNRQIIDNNPTAHAEIVALQSAGKFLENHRLIDTTLYCTLEPCAMCFGAIIHARISRVVFGTSDLKTGVCGGCIDLKEQPCFNHKLEITGGVMEMETKKILQDFFKAKRFNKKYHNANQK
jgi:tRNA(adenine34) deaminase